MSFIDYISGKREGQEAHQLEKDSQRDPFLYEAIEGYDAVQGDHLAQINKMQKAIASGKRASKGSNPVLWKIAAAILVLACGFGGYMFIDDMRMNMSSPHDEVSGMTTTAMAIDIFVPEEFYEQNERVIESQNEVLAQYTPAKEEFDVSLEVPEAVETIPKPRPRNRTSDAAKQDASTTTPSSVIDIYVPETFYDQHRENIDKENRTAIQIIEEEHDMPISIYVPENEYVRFKNKIEE